MLRERPWGTIECRRNATAREFFSRDWNVSELCMYNCLAMEGEAARSSGAEGPLPRERIGEMRFRGQTRTFEGMQAG